MLIIGALVVVGVIALVGAILLAVGEGRGSKTAPQVQAPAINAPTPARAEAWVSTPATPAPRVETTSSAQGSDARYDTRSERSDLHLDQEVASHANGQFQEIARQLQTLHDQSKDLQQRLGQLSEVIEGIQSRDAAMLEVPSVPRTRRIS